MKKKKRKQKCNIFKVLFLEIIFIGITTPFMCFYGPFTNVKNTLVGMAMTTMNHKWIAEVFLSNERINKILSENSVETVNQSNENINNVHIDTNKNDVKLSTFDGKGFKAYLIEISNPQKVKVGYAENFKKVGQSTSDIARRFNAIAAINGGSFTDKNDNGVYSGNGSSPLGVVMTNGKIIHKTVRDNDEIEVVGITKKGVLLVGKYTINRLKKLGCSEAVCYGPSLIVDGEKVKIKGDGGSGRAPKTAIGQRKDGTILLLVVDGTIIQRLGVDVRELRDILYEAGAYTAVNLDGGSSTTMYYKGSVVNNPCDSIGERAIPTIFYVEE